MGDPPRSCAIVTDTTASLPEGFAAAHGIQVVSQIVLFGEDSFLEGRTITREQFIERLMSAPILPRTAAPEPGELVEAYRKQLAQADTVLSIHPSTLVSGTVRSAETARSLAFPSADIRIINTQSIATGLGTMVQCATHWAEAGVPPDEIIVRIESLMARCRTYFMIPSLTYLQRGGRIGRASALLGGVLNIKPILTFAEGQVAPFEKVRTESRAVDRLIDLVAEQCPANGEAYLCVMHGDNEAQAAQLAARLQERIGVPEVPVLTVGSSITTHAGPGVLGASFFSAA